MTTQKRIVLTSAIARRLAAHCGPSDHVKFDLSRVLYSPELGLFLASNAVTLLAVEPQPSATDPNWKPSTQPPCSKEVWIPADVIRRAADMAGDGKQIELIDAEAGPAFYLNGSTIGVGKPSDRPMPPLSLKFFAKEPLPVATLCSASALLDVAQSLSAAAVDPSAAVTVGMNGAAWSKYPVEMGVKSAQETSCRTVIMPLMVEDNPNYILPMSGKVPGGQDAALRLLDWRTAQAPTIDKAASKEDIRMLTGLLMQMESDAPAVDPKGVDADQLTALRNLVAHAIVAVKAIRSGG